MSKNNEQNSNKGMMVLMVCGLLAVALIIACVFFPEQIFGLFFK